MDEIRSDKLRALMHAAAVVQGSPALVYLLGFLAGQVDRVHFVRHVEGAPIALRMVTGRRRLWPAPPFEAEIRGVAVADPMICVSALAGTEGPICLHLSFEGGEDEPWYQALLVDSYADIVTGKTIEQRKSERTVEDLRRRIDHALDVYNESKRLLAEADSSRAEELKVFVAMAERELQACSAALMDLQEGLGKR